MIEEEYEEIQENFVVTGTHIDTGFTFKRVFHTFGEATLYLDMCERYGDSNVSMERTSHEHDGLRNTAPASEDDTHGVSSL